MFTQAKLIMQSYIPETIKKGMWFLVMHNKEISVYPIGYDIHHEKEMEMYFQVNGYPVLPHLYLVGNPNVPDETSLIATPEQIGWFDEGKHSEDLSDITLKEINNILDNDGWCLVEMEEELLDDDEVQEDYINVVPVVFQNKVTIRYENVVDDDNDEEEEQFDDDDPPLCGNCNGSGEGSHDGAICSVCGGSGVIEDERSDDYDFDDDFDDDRYDDVDWDHYPHYDF